MMRLSTQLELEFSQVLDDRLVDRATESAQEAELDLCSICYTNEIQVDKSMAPNDNFTIEFDCKHRFCVECCQESFTNHIRDNALAKITCFEHKCG